VIVCRFVIRGSIWIQVIVVFIIVGLLIIEDSFCLMKLELWIRKLVF